MVSLFSVDSLIKSKILFIYLLNKRIRGTLIMKLRQKLAVVLASAMVVTAVPVVTMAAVPTVSKEYIGAKDTVLPSSSYVRFQTGGDIYAGEQFWATLSNSELDGYKADGSGTTTTGIITLANTTTPVGTFHWTKNNEVGFTFDTNVNKDDKFEFSLAGVKLKGDDAYFVIDPNNTGIVGTSGADKKNEVKIFIGTTKDQKGVITVGDAPNIFLEGALGDIIITEPYAGAIVKGADSDNILKIELTLNNSDYEFYQRGASDIKVAFEKGFYQVPDITLSSSTMSVEKYGDKATLLIPVSGLSSLTNGKIVISGIQVMANTKNPTEGDLKVTIGGEVSGLTDAVMAKIVSTDTKLTMKDDKVVEIIAGRKKEVEVKHAENVKDGILSNHTIEYTLDNGYLGEYTESTARPELKKATRDDKIAAFLATQPAMPSGVTVVDVKMDGSKYVGFTVKAYDKTDTANNGKLTSTEKEDFTYKLNVYTNLDTADATEVKITASGERAIDEEVSVVAVKVIAPITYTFDSMPVKVGLQKQQYAGKITITETDKGMIQRGEIVLKTAAEGYKFSGKGEVKVTSGDLVLDTPQYDKTNNQLIIPVKYTSKTASTIEVTGFEVDVDRTVPEGTFNIAIDGEALGTDGKVEAFGSISLKDFFKVTTPNTEDIKNSALKAVDAKFVVGSTEYSVDGVTKTMDAATYVQNNRTMVPLRYVAEAFGIPMDNVLFSNGVVTIIAGEKVLQFTLGSNVMSVNGAAIQMDAKAEAKDGRTYIPMKFVGTALGVAASWDSASQTASFSNKK